MINIRYKPLASGKFSIYLDIYNEVTKQRSYEFLKLYVRKDYSKENKVLSEDKIFFQKAKDILNKRETELYPESNTGNKKPGNIYQLFDVDRERNSDTSKNLIVHLKEFEKHYGCQIDDLTIEWAEKFKEHLEKKLKSSSVYTNLSVLSSYFNKATKRGLLKENPILALSIKKPKPEDLQRLSQEEIKSLKETPTPFKAQIRDAFLFSLETGLRWKDVKNLDHKQVEPAQYKGKETVKITLKYINSKEEYSIYLSEEALKIFKKYKGTTGLVFNELPNQSNCALKLHLWGALAGLEENPSFLKARNTYIIKLLRSGIPDKEVRAMVGIKRWKRTREYLNKIKQDDNYKI